MTNPDQFVIDIFLLMLAMSALCSILLTLAGIAMLTQYLWKKLTGRNPDPYRSQRPWLK